MRRGNHDTNGATVQLFGTQGGQDAYFIHDRVEKLAPGDEDVSYQAVVK